MRSFYESFNQIWVPDFAGDKNLSGKLSHQYQSNRKFFIGAISRFKKLEIPKRYDIAFVLSGPEPQRSLLEEKIIEQIKNNSDKKMILVRGTSNMEKLKNIPAHVEIVELASSDELNQIMSASDLIVSRSGYTTLLDLYVIRKKALLIPTPGQPEQEYLAEELKAKNMFFTTDQNDLDLIKDIPEALNYQGYDLLEEEIILEKRIPELLGLLVR